MVSEAMMRQVQEALASLEDREGAVVLYACESGSRAWGFASQDSDYDVRFIYIRPPQWYLSIYEGRDVIEHPVTGDLDVSGWDLRKALKLFRKSNPPLLEWLSSPVVYKDRDGLADQLRALLPQYYSPRSCMYHYLSMARGNLRDYLEGERVRAKKYFYALRPILACKWIEAGLGPVPMRFQVMLERLPLEPGFKAAVYELLERKMRGDELDHVPRIPAIGDFIALELERLDAALLAPAEEPGVAPLDGLFRNFLQRVWG